jgi:hypothetical protein
MSNSLLVSELWAPFHSQRNKYRRRMPFPCVKSAKKSSVKAILRIFGRDLRRWQKRGTSRAVLETRHGLASAWHAVAPPSPYFF